LALRAKANKEIVVISDDDAGVRSGIRSGPYINFLDNRPEFGVVHNNAIIWIENVAGTPNSVQSQTCSKGTRGNITEYVSLAAHPKYGGSLFDLCSKDWNSLLKDLANKVISTNSQSVFKLGIKADPSQPMTVFISENEVAAENWTYSSSKNSIVFDIDFAPKPGESLEINYTPAK
jgi:hypothetical protein